MKKKHLFTATMLIGTLLLASCQSPTGSTPQESATAEYTTEEQTVQESETQGSSSQTVTQIESFYRTENIEELIENVKFNEDGIYISWWNRDRDYGAAYSDYFYIISENPLNVDEMSITLPIQNEYETFILEVPQEELQHTSNTRGGLTPVWGDCPVGALPSFLYDTYRGTDWKEMLDLYGAVAGLEDDFVNRTEAQKKYSEYRFQYGDDYSFKIDPTTFPQLNCYFVCIRFGEDIQEETFQTAEIKIGDKTYIQEVGEIRLNEDFRGWWEQRELSTDKTSEELIFDSYYSQFEKTRNYPGGEGTLQGIVYVGKVQKNMTLEKLYFYNATNEEVLGANIKLSTKEQRVSGGVLFRIEDVEMDLYWDCETPLYITAGNYIQIDLTIKDPDMAKWEYGFTGTIIIEYTSDEGESYIQTSHIDINRHEFANFWVTYAMLVNEEMRENIVRYYDYYRAEKEEWRRVKFE